MEKITFEEALKRNAINLAKEHRKNCKGEDCNISLLMLAELITQADIKLTTKELKEFI